MRGRNRFRKTQGTAGTDAERDRKQTRANRLGTSVPPEASETPPMPAPQGIAPAEPTRRMPPVISEPPL